MQLLRRRFLALAAGAATLPALPRVARAADYPTRPVHLVVGFPAGSAPDIIARLVAQALSARIGQEVVVDDRPGAGGNIGTEIAAKAAPDGYTLFLAVSANAINVSLYKNLNFDFAQDLVPVGMIALTPFVIAVNPSFGSKNLSELIALAKESPGTINMATSVPILPPAPGRLSTTISWPRRADRACPASRAMMSGPLPARKPTTRWIGRVG